MESSTKMMMLLLNAAESHGKELALSISPAAEATISDELITTATDCIHAVHDVITITSALPGSESNAETVDKARKNIDSMIFERLKPLGEVKERYLLKILALEIKNQKAGNCYEFAFYAKSLLNQIDDVKSEVFRVKSDAGDSHLFLVLNRDPDTSPTDFNSWNADALVVDPYLKKVYLPQEMPAMLQSCMHDVEADEVHYLPFNPEKHTLDNLATHELIDDWRRVMSEVAKASRESHSEESTKNYSIHRAV